MTLKLNSREPTTDLTPEAEDRIDDRIRRLAHRGAPDSARDELRQHVQDATLDLAAGEPATEQHVDAAFAGLGSDDEIRQAFFPRRSRPAVDRLSMALLVGAAIVATMAVVAEDGGSASCSVRGPGSCSASTSGQALDVVVWAAPPLLVLALLAWLPAWTAVTTAALYALLGLLRAIDSSDSVVADLVLLGGGILCLAVAVRQLRINARGAATKHA